MSLCICGHPERLHGQMCDGSDPAINRNWCHCAAFKPVDRETFIAAQAERWAAYWFYTLAKARERAAAQWDAWEARA